MSCSKIVSHFSDHYASLAHESDELAKQRTECQRHFQKAMETAEDDNTKVMDVEWREGGGEGRRSKRGGCKVTLIKNIPSSSLFCMYLFAPDQHSSCRVDISSERRLCLPPRRRVSLHHTLLPLHSAPGSIPRSRG